MSFISRGILLVHMDIKSTSIIGVLVLGTLAAGGVLWYLNEHPTPIIPDHTGVATTTAPRELAAPQKIEEHADYYDVTGTIPSDTPLKDTAGDAASQAAVDAMEQYVLTSIQSFKEQGNFDHLSPEDIKMFGFDQGRKEAFTVSYTSTEGPHSISYLFTFYEDTLGAHPNTTYHTFTFDRKTGNLLALKDLFTPGTNYLSVLSKISRATLPSQLAKAANERTGDLDMAYLTRGTTPVAGNFENWYISGSTVVLTFPPYQVQAYVFGAPELSIPFSTLPIKDEYK